MSRSLIGANQSIFAALDGHCAARGSVLGNAGRGRWIASESLHRHFMMKARVADTVNFGPGRKLARFDLSTKSYLCTVGFEPNHGILRDAEVDIDPAFLTVALSELQPRPSASLSEIRQIVEFSDKDADEHYVGHDYRQVADLFPPIRIYNVGQNSLTWNTFFRACVDECDLGSSWIEGRLAGTLRSMCDLDQQRVPYRILCRSIFDSDESSFFLALYRSLESLYSYSSARELATALGVRASWVDVAAALEERLGWHPREEDSLARIICFASVADLKAVVRALGELTIPESQELVVNHAAKAIYRLRNSIVHYRPAQHKLRMESLDWTGICEAMVGIVVDVYEAVFARQSA